MKCSVIWQELQAVTQVFVFLVHQQWTVAAGWLQPKQQTSGAAGRWIVQESAEQQRERGYRTSSNRPDCGLSIDTQGQRFPLLFHRETGKCVTCSALFVSTSYMNKSSPSPGEPPWFGALGLCSCPGVLRDQSFSVHCTLQRCVRDRTGGSRTQTAAKYLWRICCLHPVPFVTLP